MKKIFVCLIFVLCFIFGDRVNAVSIGDNLNSTVGIGCNGKDSCWNDWHDTNISDNKALRGFRLTLYKFSNNTITQVGKSYDFVNNPNAVNMLKASYGISFVATHSGKVAYNLGKSAFNITKTSSTSNFYNDLHYLDFEYFFGEDEEFGKDYTKNLIEGLVKRGNNKVAEFFNQRGNDDIRLYYATLEPLTFILYNRDKTNKIYFYGTSYEHARFINENSSVGTSWVKTVNAIMLPKAANITSITETNGSNFTGFLKAAKINLADLSKDIVSTKYGYYSYQAIMKKSFGMQLFWLPNTIGVQSDNCESKITTNKCNGDISIQENVNGKKTCAFGSDDNVEYGSGNNIYCTSNVNSNFTSFYNTFNSPIRSGSYFPMNDLKIQVTKTCYIKVNNKNSSISGWQKSIPIDDAGTIKLKVGNIEYELESNVSKGTASCSDSSCTKATITTDYTYKLKPFVNQFINIETMTQDIYQYQTDKNIDNGGSRLTVPLNYLGGIYKYHLDLTNSVLGKYKTKVVNKTVNNVNVEGMSYTLIYKTNKVLSDSDLSFKCNYKASSEQCYEDGEIVPCPVPETDECKNLPEDKCCIDGKVSDCPAECKYECCDENGKEITCPGSNSFIGDIVYRPISLTNPFPGILGEGRTPGSNWNKIITVEDKQYDVVDYYITNNRGYKDYDIYNRTPLYTIKLDGEKINAIRTYNETHDYNNFDLSCVNGEYCISNFLRGKANGFNIDLLDSNKSECKNITPDNFEACLWK